MKRKERAEIYKKITLRFLKETGLLIPWKKYVSTKEYKQKMKAYECERWYDKFAVEDIFGEAQFTSFIERNCNLKLNRNIYKYFCRFIFTYYPEIAQDYDGMSAADRHFCMEASLHELLIAFPGLKIYEK